MATYKPKKHFRVAFKLLEPAYGDAVKGIRPRTYPDDSDIVLFGSLATYGGTDRTVNQLTVTADTAVVEMYYDPRVTADCILMAAKTGKRYSIQGQPEDIEGRGKYLRIRVEAMEGGA